MKLIKGLDPEPFCRTVWVSAKARSVWEWTIPAISELVQNLEVASVAEGHRKATWQTIAEDQLPAMAKKWGELGLVSLPVRYSRQWQGFAHRFSEPEQGKPKNVSVIVAKDIETCLRYRGAFETGDHDAQGAFLGFPICCRDFFNETWPAGYIDPIWQAAERSEIVEHEDKRLRIVKHPYSNPILRYLGIRVGFHLPCSFSCINTIKLATERMVLAEKIDRDKAQLLQALLSMPMSWDVLHGAAVVRTPIFYIVTSSTPTQERYVVEARGGFMPKEAATGVVFPFERKDDQEYSRLA